MSRTRARPARLPRRTTGCAVALAGCIAAFGPAQAGHGFMNTFGDIEWLPEPGQTPDSPAYPLERIAERVELGLAGDADETLALCLAFAREKLAEADAMIRAEDAAAADVAIRLYRDYVGEGRGTLDGEPRAAAGERRSRYLNALLEHVYILSVEYMDMPLGVREALGPAFEAVMEVYEAESTKLPKVEKDAMFFKEEEIRWSVEMTRQADAQGITN